MTGLVKQDFPWDKPWQLLSNLLCLSVNKVILLFVTASDILWVMEGSQTYSCVFPRMNDLEGLLLLLHLSFFNCITWTGVTISLSGDKNVKRCTVECHQLLFDILMRRILWVCSRLLIQTDLLLPEWTKGMFTICWKTNQNSNGVCSKLHKW